MAHITSYKPGAVALLGADFFNEADVLADPDLSIRIRILDELKAVRVDVTELIGGLVLIENPSVGKFQFRHTVITNDRANQHVWMHEWTAASAVPPAPEVVNDDCFLVKATDFPP